MSFAIYVPHAVRVLDGLARGNGYLIDDQDRLLDIGRHPGTASSAADRGTRADLCLANYAVLMPATLADAAPYGINAITMEGGPAFLRYLLLPRWQVADQTLARYVICFGCDTTPWDHRTIWLWKDVKGDAIGRVRGKAA